MTAYILVTMFFAGGLIPTYLVIRKLGLIDSRWVLILPLLANGFYIIIMRNYLMTVDPAFEESAFMDGANYLQIMARIVAPLCKPVLATIALWTMVLHWNSWFDALIYLRDESKIVLQLLLRRLLLAEQATLDRIREFGGPIDAEDRLPSEAVKAATTLITIGPIILVYPLLQRYFIKGIFLGSLKDSAPKSSPSFHGSEFEGSSLLIDLSPIRVAAVRDGVRDALAGSGYGDWELVSELAWSTSERCRSA